MKQIIAVIVFGILLIILGFFIGKSCSENEKLSNLNQIYEQNKKSIKAINGDVKALRDSMFILAQQRNITNKYYKYEISKIESVYVNDGSYATMDSVIRHWTEIIYGLPSFFSNKIGVIPDSEDSTTSSKLLPSDKQSNKRIRYGESSSW